MPAGAFRSKVEDLYRVFVSGNSGDATQSELRRLLRPADKPRPEEPLTFAPIGPPSTTTPVFGTVPQSSTPIFGSPPRFGPGTGG